VNGPPWIVRRTGYRPPLVEAGRPHQPGVHLGPVGGDGREALRLGELAAGDELVAGGGDLPVVGPCSLAARRRLCRRRWQPDRRARAGGWSASRVDEHAVDEVVEPDRALATDEKLRLAEPSAATV
jgi:hypothetical protein